MNNEPLNSNLEPEPSHIVGEAGSTNENKKNRPLLKSLTAAGLIAAAGSLLHIGAHNNVESSQLKETAINEESSVIDDSLHQSTTGEQSTHGSFELKDAADLPKYTDYSQGSAPETPSYADYDQPLINEPEHMRPIGPELDPVTASELAAPAPHPVSVDFVENTPSAPLDSEELIRGIVDANERSQKNVDVDGSSDVPR